MSNPLDIPRKYRDPEVWSRYPKIITKALWTIDRMHCRIKLELLRPFAVANVDIYVFDYFVVDDPKGQKLLVEFLENLDVYHKHHEFGRTLKKLQKTRLTFKEKLFEEKCLITWNDICYCNGKSEDWHTADKQELINLYDIDPRFGN